MIPGPSGDCGDKVKVDGKTVLVQSDACCGTDSHPDECFVECAHDMCVEGVALDAACDPCVASVCGFDDWCCTVSWDSKCVCEAQDYCDADCGYSCDD